MKATRSWIEHKHIIGSIPVDQRFFQLPVENYLDVIGVEPNKVQIQIINQLNDPRCRYLTCCVSRRVGKSFIQYTCAFLKLLEPGASVLVMQPNYSIANIGWDEIKKLLKGSGVETVKENAKDKEIELENGSFFKLGSVNRADSVVGRSYDLVIYEEAQIDRRGGDTFDVQIGPMLDKLNSKQLFISTPRGDNWFRTFYDRGVSQELSRWASIHGTYRDNPRVPESVIEEARRTCSPQKFRQEYEADFDVFETQIFTCFDQERHVVNNTPVFDGTFEFIMGVDHGYSDSTAASILLYHGQADRFYICDEYEQARLTTQQHAENFRVKMDKYGVDGVFIDPAAQQFGADLQMLHDISTIKQKKSTLDSIEYIQSLFQQDKIFVLASCEKHIMMLRNYQWDPEIDPSRDPRPLHDEYSHIADAFRYAIYTFVR